MGVIAHKQLTQIKGLIKVLPQTSLRSLELALGLSKDEAMSTVRDLISGELEHRYVKEAVFAPYLPMFSARSDGLDSVLLPTWLLDSLWNVLEMREPELHTQARYALRGLRSDDPTPVVFFRLVTAGALICRDTPAVLLENRPDARDEETVAEFANYLDLHRLARNLLHRLPNLQGRIDADQAASLRLMFKDACANDPAGGCRLLEILFANLEDGAQIIKFIATVCDRAGEKFLAASELGVFGERILTRIDERLSDLWSYMGGRNRVVEDLGLAGDKVAQVLSLIQDFENYIDLSRDGGWGKRISDGHKLVAEVVEAQLKSSERVLENVLPIKSERVHGRVRRESADLTRFPDEGAIVRARQVVRFVRNVRNVAHSGGFSSLHTRTVQELEAALDTYFEDLLSTANGDEPFNAERVMAYFDLVTDLMDALCGEEKAKVARRRVASSDLSKPGRVTLGA